MNTDSMEWLDQDTVSSHDELEFKDRVVENLVDSIHEYLQFSTVRDLMKLIALNL